MASTAPHILIIIAAIIMLIVVIAGAGTLLALLFWKIREAFGLPSAPDQSIATD